MRTVGCCGRRAPVKQWVISVLKVNCLLPLNELVHTLKVDSCTYRMGVQDDRDKLLFWEHSGKSV